MKYVIAVAMLFVAACVTAARPASFAVDVNPALDGAACAASKLSAMGYTVDSRNRDLGLVRATKRDGGNRDYVATTVDVALVEESGVKKMRVTADVMRHFNGGRNTQPLGETKYARADVQTILNSCGAKQATGQADRAIADL
jgi:hypothetical protein